MLLIDYSVSIFPLLDHRTSILLKCHLHVIMREGPHPQLQGWILICPRHSAHDILLVAHTGPEVGTYSKLTLADLKEALAFHGWGRDFPFLLLDMHEDSLVLTLTGSHLVAMKRTSLKMKSALKMSEQRDGNNLSIRLLIILCLKAPLLLDFTLSWVFYYINLKYPYWYTAAEEVLEYRLNTALTSGMSKGNSSLSRRWTSQDNIQPWEL